jgi:hypothetical protein
VGELADETVGGGAEGDGKDETDRKQLDGDLLEGADALGDGVGCKTLLVPAVPWSARRVTATNQSAPPSMTVLAYDAGRRVLVYIQGQATSSWEWPGGAGSSQAAGRGRRAWRAA